MRQKTIKLSEPVEFAGQTYAQLTLRKLKVKHMLEVNMDAKNPFEQFIAMAAASAAVDIGVIHELDMDDFLIVQETLEGFTRLGNPSKAQSTSE
jgi:hypothetical protein